MTLYLYFSPLQRLCRPEGVLEIEPWRGIYREGTEWIPYSDQL